MSRTRTRTRIAAGVIAAAAALAFSASNAAAGGNNGNNGNGGNRAARRVGSVYTLTNAPTGNAVVEFDRLADGSLSEQGSYPTNGLGTGAGLGSQGALALDGNHLFAVNAASNSISEFGVRPHGLVLESTVASGGTTPISVTVNDHVLYVLNGGSSNITGFLVGAHDLIPLPRSTRALSPGAAGPAEVSFSPDGDALVVTEKTSNTIDTFRVGFGFAGQAVSSPSAGGTPFGFDFDRRSQLLVSNADRLCVVVLARPARSALRDQWRSPDRQCRPVLARRHTDSRYAYTAERRRRDDLRLLDRS